MVHLEKQIISNKFSLKVSFGSCKHAQPTPIFRTLAAIVMKHSTIQFLILIMICGCKPKNLLENYYKYDIQNTYSVNSENINLIQNICYNSDRRKNKNLKNSDEFNWCYIVYIDIKDTATAKLKRKLNLENDTATISANFIVLENQMKLENNKISGTVEIIHLSKDYIVLKENLTTIRENNNVKYLKGIQSFHTKTN